MSDVDAEFVNRIRNDHFLSLAMQRGRDAGLSEHDTLRKFVMYLLDLKDECFQRKLDEAMNSNNAMIFQRKP